MYLCAGDILLAVFKANSRNALLLEEFLAIRGEEYIKLEVEKRKKPIATPGPSKQTAAEQGQVEEVLTEKEIVEIVKPGSGLKPGEVIPSQEPAAKERTVASTSQAQPQSSNGGSRKRSLLGTLRRRKEPSSDKSQ